MRDPVPQKRVADNRRYVSAVVSCFLALEIIPVVHSCSAYYFKVDPLQFPVLYSISAADVV